MKNVIDAQDLPHLQQLLGEEISDNRLSDLQQDKLGEMLAVSRHQQQLQWQRSFKTQLVYLLLFIFLYLALGASLTLQQTLLLSLSERLAYAVESLPVLIAFSGYFISVLFLLFARSSSRHSASWTEALRLLEKYRQMELTRFVEQLNYSSRNYSHSSLTTALALFICLTWVVIYNYFTFITSGVIGSVISLFITTMVYVILDIQMLKSDNPVEPPSTPNVPETENDKS